MVERKKVYIFGKRLELTLISASTADTFRFRVSTIVAIPHGTMDGKPPMGGGGGWFTYVRIPCDESLDVEELTAVALGYAGDALPNLVCLNARYLCNIQATAMKKITSCRALWAGLWRNMCGETALGFTRLRGCLTVKRPTRPEYCAGKRSVSGADIGTLRPVRASAVCNAPSGRLSPDPQSATTL